MSKCKQCTLSTTSGVGQPCIALLDQVPFQKNLQCCTRTVSNWNHHPLCAMRSQQKVRISTMGLYCQWVGRKQTAILLTWHNTYVIEWGETFCILMICATCALTFMPEESLFARQLFSMMFAPSPSPATSFAEEGDVKIALKDCQKWDLSWNTRYSGQTWMRSLLLKRPSSRLPWLVVYFS